MINVLSYRDKKSCIFYDEFTIKRYSLGSTALRTKIMYVILSTLNKLTSETFWNVIVPVHLLENVRSVSAG